jgi:sugar-specific transcriptional regulator TrmB
MRPVTLRAETEGRIVDALTEMNFTATDARAYIALLKGAPATGYEISARSGLPRSAIYTVLKKLEASGLINAIQQDPVRYVPLPPERLLELLESRFQRNLSQLKDSLKSLRGKTAEAPTWTVHGYPALLEQAEQLIGGTKEVLVGSLWGREAQALAPRLREAVARDVELIFFSFTPLPEDIGHTYSYGISEEKLASYWEHKIILVADHERALIGGAQQTEHTQAVITEVPALIEVAISNLVLDLTLFGQRHEHDMSEVIAKLIKSFAPIEELVNAPNVAVPTIMPPRKARNKGR